MSAELDVVQDGHAFEEFDILKGARNAHLSNRVGVDADDVFSSINDPAFLGGIESADTV